MAILETERLALRRIQGVRADNRGSVNVMRRPGFRLEKGTYPGEGAGILDDYPKWRQER